MRDVLWFDETEYVLKTTTLEDRTITYRAYEELQYCRFPVDNIQKLNLYAPDVYWRGGCVNGYDRFSAPIFITNLAGGYLPGQPDKPGSGFKGWINAAFEALEHGCVVVCPGIRGRSSGQSSTEFFVGGGTKGDGDAAGKMVGKAPALIVDMKAAIRYLRYNRDLIPGNTERIVTTGISAGGALSAMTGATGNSVDFEPYLSAIGAADERDDIFAANCYCPIHNLENSDTAYEWIFGGCEEFHGMKMVRTNGGVKFHPSVGRMTDKQIQLAKELKRAFPAYVNSLNLRDESGKPLTLNEEGDGSFRGHVIRLLLASAQHELDTHETVRCFAKAMVQGSEVENQPFLTIENGKATSIDMEAFAQTITRMKQTPAFDALDLSSPENDEFGTESVQAKHFTAFSAQHSEVDGAVADAQIVKMLNPTRYIGEAQTAKHWRIRHGVYDRDTSIAIQVILATMLQNHGCSVDFALPWGLPHTGDYEFGNLFKWIDEICRQKKT